MPWPPPYPSPMPSPLILPSPWPLPCSWPYPTCCSSSDSDHILTSCSGRPKRLLLIVYILMFITTAAFTLHLLILTLEPPKLTESPVDKNKLAMYVSTELLWLTKKSSKDVVDTYALHPLDVPLLYMFFLIHLLVIAALTEWIFFVYIFSVQTLIHRVW